MRFISLIGAIQPVPTATNRRRSLHSIIAQLDRRPFLLAHAHLRSIPGQPRTGPTRCPPRSPRQQRAGALTHHCHHCARTATATNLRYETRGSRWKRWQRPRSLSSSKSSNLSRRWLVYCPDCVLSMSPLTLILDPSQANAAAVSVLDYAWSLVPL